MPWMRLKKLVRLHLMSNYSRRHVQLC
jgi:hypothetical protein